MGFVPVPGRSLATDHANEIEHLMQQYGNDILRVCFLYLRDVALAEDATQETFLKAYKSMDGFRRDSSEKSWLMRIAINTCKDMRRGTWFRIIDRHTPLEKLPEPTCTFEPQDVTLTTEVMRLPAKYKDVTILRYYQNMQLGEIAKALGIPEGTVSTRLKRARARLRSKLERWYLDE